jgi:oligopeptidase B
MTLYPLTIDEYKEWGNPEQKETYDYILSYSPYQNIRQQEYPNVLLIASYKDYQTPVWQIAKYASKIREHNLSDSEVLFIDRHEQWAYWQYYGKRMD